jgi:hypothetical protein
MQDFLLDSGNKGDYIPNLKRAVFFGMVLKNT